MLRGAITRLAAKREGVHLLEVTSSREEMRALLDINHKWPSHYTFKFIVPEVEVARMREILKGALPSGERAEERPSSKGHYVSFSLTKMMSSADAVMDMYDLVRAVPGLVAI
jgi:hypothetical protein